MFAPPPAFTRNPSNCHKFVVNMFKAGSGKCRDCGHEWHQHEGVIDKQVADKFIQIWNHNQQKISAAAAANAAFSHKTEEEVRDEERREYVAAQRRLNSNGSGMNRSGSKEWLGGDDSGRSTSIRKPNHHADSSGEEEEDFKCYSREEFLSKVPSAVSGNTPIAKPVKVVNLIDFSQVTTESTRRPSFSGSNSPYVTGSSSPRLPPVVGTGSASPRLPPVGGSIQPGNLSLPLTNLHLRGTQSPRSDSSPLVAAQGLKKLEVIEQQLQSITRELHEKALENDVLRRRLGEQESVAEKNKDQTRNLLDQLDAAMRSNSGIVQELQDQLAASRQAREDNEANIERLQDALQAQQSQPETAILEIEKLREQALALSQQVQSVHEELYREQTQSQRLANEAEAAKEVLAVDVQRLQEELTHERTQSLRLQSELHSTQSLIQQVEILKPEIQRLNEVCNAREAENQQLVAELQSTRMSSGEVESLREECFRLHEQVQHLSTASADLTAAQAHCHRLQSELDALGEVRNECERLHRELNALSEVKSECHRLQSELDALGEVRNECERLHGELNALSEVKSECHRLHGELDALAEVRNECERLHRELNALSEVKSQCQRLEEEIKVSTSTIESLQEENQLMKEKKYSRGSEDSIDDVKQQISQLTDANAVLRKESHQLKASLEEVQLQLRTEQDVTTHLCENGRDTIKSLRTQIEQLSGELDETKTAANAEIEALRGQQDAESSLRGEVESSLSQAHAEIEALRGQRDAESSLRGAVQGEVESERITVAQLNSYIEDIVAEKTRLTDQFNRVDVERLRLCTELQEVRSRSEAIETDLTDRIDREGILISEISKLREELKGVRIAQQQLVEAKSRLDQVETELTSTQLRLEEEANLKNQAMAQLELVQSSSEKMSGDRDQLKNVIDELRDQVRTLEIEKQTVLDDLRNKAVESVSVESKIGSATAEIESLKATLHRAEAELEFTRSQLSSESDIGRAESVRLSTELADVQSKLSEAQADLSREIQNGVSIQARVMQSEHVIDDLKSRLAAATSNLEAVTQQQSTSEISNRTSVQYLRAIQDASFVMKTVTDKFISPNTSAANSRAISVVQDEDGPEAVGQLDRNVKALLRLVEAVSDKSKILEKENLALENRLRDFEGINNVLREKANQSLVHRLIEPIISCKWSNGGGRIGSNADGMPMQPRSNGEMSHLLVPPRQYGGMSP